MTVALLPLVVELDEFENPATDPGRLRYLLGTLPSRSAYPREMRALARNPNTPLDLLADIAPIVGKTTLQNPAIELFRLEEPGSELLAKVEYFAQLDVVKGYSQRLCNLGERALYSLLYFLWFSDAVLSGQKEQLFGLIQLVPHRRTFALNFEDLCSDFSTHPRAGELFFSDALVRARYFRATLLEGLDQVDDKIKAGEL